MSFERVAYWVRDHLYWLAVVMLYYFARSYHAQASTHFFCHPIAARIADVATLSIVVVLVINHWALFGIYRQKKRRERRNVEPQYRTNSRGDTFDVSSPFRTKFWIWGLSGCIVLESVHQFLCRL